MYYNNYAILVPINILDMVILAILFNQQMDYKNYKIKVNENIPK